ncbi:MAG: MarR family winged helix-turn-helix transcriptional regulator [Sandaracinaceae bacterium]
MATRKPSRRRTRAEVTEDLLGAGRVLSTAAIMFHTKMAALHGLSASDEKAIDLIDRFGPLTAGELASRSGLAPASVTGLLDRLEKRGYVRRSKDPDDGRRVVIEVDRAKLGEAFGASFGGLVQELHALCAGFTVGELEVVARWVHGAARAQEVATERLPDPGA